MARELKVWGVNLGGRHRSMERELCGLEVIQPELAKARAVIAEIGGAS